MIDNNNKKKTIIMIVMIAERLHIAGTKTMLWGGLLFRSGGTLLSDLSMCCNNASASSGDIDMGAQA